jgi:hypothetical protein
VKKVSVAHDAHEVIDDLSAGALRDLAHELVDSCDDSNLTEIFDRVQAADSERQMLAAVGADPKRPFTDPEWEWNR